MRVGLGVDRYTKFILTLIVVLLAALLCKPLFLAEPVTAYNTTADDAYYHADEAYYLAQEALEKAEKAYSYADEAYETAEKAHKRADEAYDEAVDASNACWRMERELPDAVMFVRLWLLALYNRQDLVKLGEKLEIAVSPLEELMRKFDEAKQPEE